MQTACSVFLVGSLSFLEGIGLSPRSTVCGRSSSNCKTTLGFPVLLPVVTDLWHAAVWMVQALFLSICLMALCAVFRADLKNEAAVAVCMYVILWCRVVLEGKYLDLKLLHCPGVSVVHKLLKCILTQLLGAKLA